MSKVIKLSYEYFKEDLCDYLDDIYDKIDKINDKLENLKVYCEINSTEIENVIDNLKDQ